MPRSVYEGDRRGPFAALLILIGLLFSSGSLAAPGGSLRDAGARAGSVRAGTAAPSLRSADAATPADDAGRSATPSFLRPPPPHIVFELLAARPRQQGEIRALALAAKAPVAPYQARAPPAA